MIIDRVLEWAQNEEAVKAIILQGSRATDIHDELSDYDLSIFCSTSTPYLQSDVWLSSFGKIWVCVHEQYSSDKRIIPTRLCIFEGGVKIDFAFFPLDALASSALPDGFNRGYVVLLDKDGMTDSMPKATYKERSAEKPSKEEFHRIVTEFWFEVYHVAKYLWRNDLWSAKFRIGKQFLLKMIYWYEEAKRNWQTALPPDGKRMQSWVEPATWDALHLIFAHFDAADSFKALTPTLALFRKLAIATASKLGCEYPHDVDHHITDYCSLLQTNGRRTG